MIEYTRTKARPERIRVRLWDAGPPDAISLDLPARTMWHVGLIFAAFFLIFAAVEWVAIIKIPWEFRNIADLVFTLFQVFWVLGWSVGVLILLALAILFFFYSESARLQGPRLVHAARLGPISVLVDYDLAKVRNVRVESIPNSPNPDEVRLRFDYGDGVNSLGNTMPRAEGQRLVETIASAVAAFPPVASRVPTPSASTALPAEAPAETAPPPPLTSISVLALVAANVVPLFGVLLFGWDMAAIMVLFWAESGIIAFYTVLKMAVVGKFMALLAVPFFIGHFGAFMAMHFLFIYLFFLRGFGAGSDPAIGDVLRVVFIPIWTSIAALFISHGVSFVTNFIGRREYAATNLSTLMNAPYSRIMLMQVTLILGGWIILLMNSPAGALVLLIVLKTVFDLSAHRKERTRVRKAA